MTQSCLAIRFAQLISSGKIQAALRLLSEGSSNSLLNPSEFVEAPGGTKRSVMELLEEKHPDSQPASTVENVLSPALVQSFLIRLTNYPFNLQLCVQKGVLGLQG